MEERILSLIYDYSINGKKVDNNFVETLVGMLVGYKGLSEYLSTIYYVNDYVQKDKTKLRVADYNLIDRFLSINIDSMNRYVQMYTNYYSSKFNDTERKFFGNYLVTQIILHELEHVSQNKKYNSYEYDDESVLINMGVNVSYMLQDPITFFRELHEEGYSDTEINSLLKNQVELYKKYYPYNPTERLAQIKSYNTMTEVLEPIYNDIPNLYMYNSYNFFKNLIDGYEVYTQQVECPTDIYVNGMGYQQELYRLSFYNPNKEIMTNKAFSQYSKIERLSYGFPVTMEEYDDTKKLLIKCDKF